jgi:hypothetical protein
MARPGSAASCSAVNNGNGDVELTIAMIGMDGNAVFPPGSTTLPAGQAITLIQAGGAGAAYVFCRFTITSGKKKDVRASICVYNGAEAISSACSASADAR